MPGLAAAFDKILRMRRPPLALTFLSILLLALGTTGGAVMSLLRPQIQQASAESIFAAPQVHYLSGSRGYDAEVVQDIVGYLGYSALRKRCLHRTG